ncbi:NAD(P)/FAD-dependent oxidoreductase [Streptomyces sp. N35]|uniref:FAD-dependent oxidoreductase n=1 Tax=Streptomyces sp. N35 TaxID=2795730 RepID=UPI0018F4EF02|nr:NAD(P)/FAD-dependent oxidoreductase [Streptomyces sp. N35]
MRTPDVLVAGAGPGGCVSALQFAARGAQVELIDPGGPDERRFSGEWIHPGGVHTLRAAGLPLDGPQFMRNHGFIVHTTDGDQPITLTHPDATAISMPHHVLTEFLHHATQDHPGITALTGHRVLSATPTGEAQTTNGHYRARLVIGADGRTSAVRRALRPHEAHPIRLSHTAGLLLQGADLPTEEYGHIFLGGPGPVLAYRLTPDLLRVTFDIPHPPPPARAAARYVGHRYLPFLPRALRTALRTWLATGRRFQWAVNSFRPRTFYGQGRVALIGDALGHNHPLAAHGMTMAVMDAERLAHSPKLAHYATQSAITWTPEHVAAVLCRLFIAPDTTSQVLRDSLFTDWRTHPERARQAIQLLGVLDTRRTPVATTFLHTALGTLRIAGPSGTPPSRWPASLKELLSWSAWLSSPHPPAQAERGRGRG